MVAVCCVTVSPLRAEPAHKSEMVSQQLFGEYCEILETPDDEWTRIRCLYDGYEGWCPLSHIVEIGQHLFDAKEKALSPDWINKISYNGQPMNIPLGSSLPGIKNGRLSWHKNQIIYDGKTWNPLTANKSGLAITGIAYKFLNTPYLWGGKTVFGADCSGYTQTVFKFFDLFLKRDAWMQAEQGKLVASLQQSVCGDLAFFNNDKGKVTHVGILLNDHEIIHASGKVRIDKINEHGIVHAQTLQQTHQLNTIRRYF